ncbi:MAG: amino acid adenylation domain-containing protein, partial [Actinocatenispora sp.]
MTDASLADRLARLSPEQRAQLSRRMREKATAAKPAGTDPTPTAAPIPRIDRSTGRLPMSHAARRLYFLQKLQPDSPAYNNVEAVRVRGAVRPHTVRAALAAVVARHELLRTVCAPDGGPVTATVAGTGDTGATSDDAEPTLLLVDRRPTVEVVDLGPDGSPADAQALFAEHADRPFDLDREVPLRVTLARLADDDHAVLFVAHHVATDAWSCRLLVREFFEAYRAATAGGTDERPAPDLQYADFAGWQRDQLRADAVRGHLDYWRDRLVGAPPVLELPLERPRPPVRSDHGAELHLDVDDALRRRLPVAAREAGVTPFALLLTAFGYVLHRHCATEDVVVGIPVSGRDRVELEALVGCFINTVVLRLDLDLGAGAALSRRDLVRRVWDGMLADLDHQALPFEHLVAELRPERDLSVGQLVQVMVNHYPATELAEPVPGLDVRPLDVPRRRAKFDLTCTVLDGREHTRIVLNYATALLTGPQAERIGAHLVAVLDALLGDLDAPAGTLPPVPPGETEPATPVVPAGTPVLDRFERHARSRPEHVAVRCPDEAVSYGELDRRAGELAGYLAARLPASAPVALLFERSVDHVVAMLAALKAGRTYVPLDPAMPPGHLSAVLDACDAGLVLTHAEVDATTRAEVAAGPVPVVALRDVHAAGPSSGTPRPATPDAAMYVLFTSGSTGRPKGVVVEHRQFTAYLTSLVDRLGLPDGLDFAIVSTLAADLGLTNLYGALGTGGTVHVLPYEWATDPARFAGYFRDHPIDVMKLVPSHLAAIAEADLLADVVPARHLVLAGEACPWDLVDAVRAARPECAVWNHYGPTETTVSVLACPVPATTDPGRGATVPLGVPFDHVGVHVLDRHLRPVPRGAAGELVITGASVARGYLSPEDDAAGRFVPDPFGTGADARAYRSGDRARFRTDGTVEFLGRLDRQAKIRGYRVEPSYVEAVLRRHPAVADVAVAVRQDRGDRATLVAYHVPDPQGTARSDVPSLTEFARAAMPPYMVPGAWVMLDRLPLTRNGKLDWQALPAPDPGA